MCIREKVCSLTFRIRRQRLIRRDVDGCLFYDSDVNGILLFYGFSMLYAILDSAVFIHTI
jgi:hypothetical protein